jgi:uncharacterized metal-binding protein
MSEKVLIVPCSGIGKTYGSVAREAAYIAVEELRPAKTEIAPLSLIVLGDEATAERVRCYPAVTIDGCKLACASKMVAETGGRVAAGLTVLDTYRQHRDLKPQGISQLNDKGLELAHVLAEEIAAQADRALDGKEEEHA